MAVECEFFFDTGGHGGRSEVFGGKHKRVTRRSVLKRFWRSSLLETLFTLTDFHGFFLRVFRGLEASPRLLRMRNDDEIHPVFIFLTTAQKIPVGETTVLHVVIKQFDPLPPTGKLWNRWLRNEPRQGDNVLSPIQARRSPQNP